MLVLVLMSVLTLEMLVSMSTTTSMLKANIDDIMGVQ